MFVNAFNFFSKNRRSIISRFYFPVLDSKVKNSLAFEHNKLDKSKEDNRDYAEVIEEKLKEQTLKAEKKKELNRKYYLQNKDKRKQYDREYRIQNREKKKEYHRNYYLQNKEKIKEYDKEYIRIQKKDMKKEYNQKYRIQNKDKIKETKREYNIRNKDKKKELNRMYRILNKNKIKEYHIKNKDKRKKSLIKKYIERNNGTYVPFNSWKTDESIRQYFDRIAPLLHINDLSDWYRISRDQIINMKGRGIFYRFNSLGKALKVAYPDYDWDMSKFSYRAKKSIQRWLYVKLKKLLPNTEIVEEYHHPELLWEENTNKTIQLDIWVSELKLALEYQGEHHYYDIPDAFGPGSTTLIFNERDEKKRQICASKGINLVCIPYWWDGHEDSLSSTLHVIFPDVFHKTNSPPIAPTNLPKE